MSSSSSRKGNINCCVVGYGKTYGNTEKTICFYVFPPDNYVSRSRREKWVNAVKRQDKDGRPWLPTKNTRICSTHFVDGAKSDHPHHPAYVPTIFPTHQSISKAVDSRRFQRLEQRKHHQQLAEKKLAEEKSTAEEESAQDNCGSVLEHSTEELPVTLSREVECQTEETSDVWFANEVFDKTFTSCLYSKENVGTVDSSTQTTMAKASSSVLPSKETRDQKCGLDSIDGHNIPGRCLECDCFHGIDSIKNEEQLNDLTGVKKIVFNNLLELLKPRQEVKVTKANKLLIFLIKLKTDLTFSSLGVLFSLHRTRISRIFFEVLENLAQATKDYIYWPSKDTVIKTLPACFKTHYPQCRVIIDCTEFKVQQPAKISDRINLYSHYTL